MTHKWAVAQVNSGKDYRENLDRAEKYISQAAGEDCKLIAFPEHFLCRDKPSRIFDNPWTLTSEPVKRLVAAARSESIGILAGSLPLQDSEDDALVYNTCLYIDPSGTIAGQYRKIHLFDAHLDERHSIRESEFMERGEKVVDLEIQGVHCGLSICYDLRFPEIFRILAERRVQAIFVPSCFTARTGRAHWEPLLKGRAIENQCYIIAPNQIGMNPGTRIEAHGRSLVIDPWGELVAGASAGEGWFSFRLDVDYIHQVRKKLPSLNHIELRGE